MMVSSWAVAAPQSYASLRGQRPQQRVSVPFDLAGVDHAAHGKRNDQHGERGEQSEHCSERSPEVRVAQEPRCRDALVLSGLCVFVERPELIAAVIDVAVESVVPVAQRVLRIRVEVEVRVDECSAW